MQLKTNFLFLSLNSTVIQSTLKPSDYDQHLQMRVKKKLFSSNLEYPLSFSFFQDFLYFIFNEILLFPSVFAGINVISSIFFQILFHWETKTQSLLCPTCQLCSHVLCKKYNFSFQFHFPEDLRIIRVFLKPHIFVIGQLVGESL